MNNRRNHNHVENAFNNLADRCQNNLGLVLTESDLKCQAYLELLRVREFSQESATAEDDIRTIPLHTETKFFDQNGNLTESPDLVITAPQQLSLRRRLDGRRQNSKGFHFNGSSILIELKFLRHNRRESTQKIFHDIEKGRRLNERQINFHLFVVVFDRYGANENDVRHLFHQNRDQDNLTCLYYSLNMQP